MFRGEIPEGHTPVQMLTIRIGAQMLTQTCGAGGGGGGGGGGPCGGGKAGGGATCAATTHMLEGAS